MAVRSSSGMKTSVRRVITTSTPGCATQQLLQPQRDVEHQLRFIESLHLRARVVPAMAGVDDDARDAEPELPRQRESALQRSPQADRWPAGAPGSALEASFARPWRDRCASNRRRRAEPAARADPARSREPRAAGGSGVVAAASNLSATHAPPRADARSRRAGRCIDDRRAAFGPAAQQPAAARSSVAGRRWPGRSQSTTSRYGL